MIAKKRLVGISMRARAIHVISIQVHLCLKIVIIIHVFVICGFLLRLLFLLVSLAVLTDTLISKCTLLLCLFLTCLIRNLLCLGCCDGFLSGRHSDNYIVVIDN